MGPCRGQRSRSSKPKYASDAGKPRYDTTIAGCSSHGFQHDPRSVVRKKTWSRPPERFQNGYSCCSRWTVDARKSYGCQRLPAICIVATGTKKSAASSGSATTESCRASSASRYIRLA